MSAWVSGDRAKLARIPVADDVLRSLPPAPARGWMSSCDEDMSECSIKFTEDSPEKFTTIASFNVGIELGVVSGWNIMSLTQN